MRRVGVFLVLFLGVALFGVTSLHAAPPQKIVIGHQDIFGKLKKPPVPFDHAAHVKRLKKNCVKCHHKYTGKGEPKKCSACHGKKKEGKKVSLKNAFHKKCKKCHKAMGRKDLARKCSACHKKK